MKKNARNRDKEIAQKALERAVASLREARKNLASALAALAEVRRTIQIAKRRKSGGNGKVVKSGEHGG